MAAKINEHWKSWPWKIVRRHAVHEASPYLRVLCAQLGWRCGMLNGSRREWHVRLGPRGAAVSWVSSATGTHLFVSVMRHTQTLPHSGVAGVMHFASRRQGNGSSQQKPGAGPFWQGQGSTTGRVRAHGGADAGHVFRAGAVERLRGALRHTRAGGRGLSGCEGCVPGRVTLRTRFFVSPLYSPGEEKRLSRACPFRSTTLTAPTTPRPYIAASSGGTTVCGALTN